MNKQNFQFYQSNTVDSREITRIDLFNGAWICQNFMVKLEDILDFKLKVLLAINY